MSAVEDLRDEMFAVGKANLEKKQPAMGATVLYYAAALRDALVEDAERMSEIDRNARAYGWSVGRGHPMVERIEDVDEENPFMDPNWRERIGVVS